MKSEIIKEWPDLQRKERGAAIIMVYLAILMFLFVAILFLDIPYMERVGRTVQRATDAASLAGVVQLNQRNYPTRVQGWIDAKRAAFAAIRASPIAGISTPIVTSFQGDTYLDPSDSLDNSIYGYETFSIGNGVQSGILTITRGVYERPAPVYPMPEIFYSLEKGSANRGDTVTGDSLDEGNCVATPLGDLNALPSACRPSYAAKSATYGWCDPTAPPPICILNALLFMTPGIPAGYISSAAGNGSPPVEYIADSVRVTLTINGIPTLFAKLLGFDSFISITRTATAGPM